MESEEPLNATWTGGEEGTLGSRIEEVRRLLLRRRERVAAEIRDYPTPIPRCDAQFNHLLDERAGLAQRLRQLEAVTARDPLTGDSADAIEQLIESLESEFKE